MTGIPDLPPALFLIAGALLIPLLAARARPLVGIVAPLAGLIWLVQFDYGTLVTVQFAGFDLVLLQVSRMNFIFGVIFLLISSVASLYAWHLRDVGQQMAALLYGGGALGVTFAGDFLTLLIFWELMAISSAWLVFARRDPESTAAGFRYLLVHFAGGSILFGGIILLYAQTGSLQLAALTPAHGIAAWLILIGVCVNVALPPFHAWLPDAYPRATVTGAIFMSALTTKSAVYVLLVIFPGWEILIYAGVIMTLYGVVYAVLANDIRLILAYHIVSQVGFMVAGVGIGTELSMSGTAAHAYSHILYKALLFMGAGAVIYATGRSKLTELGGIGPKMRMVFFLFMIGAFSISGFPLLNGFISKSIIISSAGYAHYSLAALLLQLASVGTFLSVALKIPAFAFMGPDRRINVRPVPVNMLVAMGILAFLCALYGVAPGLLYGMLPYDVEYHPFTAYHLVESIQLLTFTFIAFYLLRAKVGGQALIALDTDWFYRRTGPLADGLLVAPVLALFGAALFLRQAIVAGVVRVSRNPHGWLTGYQEGRERFDPDAERGPLGASIGLILLSAVVLAVVLLAL